MQAGSPAYFVPTAEVISEQTIHRSRFICHLGPGNIPVRIHTKLNRLRDLHPRAGHLCWAFIAGAPKTAERGMSDDGEPKGTAGRPMLQVLDHSGFGETWVAVVRYFGGIKLGRGGLIRAYTSSVQRALAMVEPISKQPLVQFRLVLDYNLLPLFERSCWENRVEIRQKSYGAQVEMMVAVPPSAVAELHRDLRQISSGAAVLQAI